MKIRTKKFPRRARLWLSFTHLGDWWPKSCQQKCDYEIFLDIGVVMKMMMTLILSREANKVSTDAPTILCLEKRKVMRWSPPFKIFSFWNPFIRLIIIIIKTKWWNEGQNPFLFLEFEYFLINCYPIPSMSTRMVWGMVVMLRNWRGDGVQVEHNHRREGDAVGDD